MGCVIPAIILAFFALIGAHRLTFWLWGWATHPLVSIVEVFAAIAVGLFLVRLLPQLADRVGEWFKGRSTKQ